MNRNTIVSVLILIIVIGGIVWYGATRPAPQAPGSAQTATSTVPEMGPYTEHASYYDIAANYPTSTPLSTSADVAARAQMRAWISDEIATFKQNGNFDNLTQNDIQMMGYDQGRKETLDIKYLIASSPRTVSYIYTEYLDTLGAHPNGFFKTFTFDTETGAFLSLADTFQRSSDYLSTLSRLSSAQLEQNMGDLAVPEMIADGTKPTEANFSNWFFDNGDFVLLFPPYQVAAYAAGPQTVRIPVSTLKPLLMPAYQQ